MINAKIFVTTIVINNGYHDYHFGYALSLEGFWFHQLYLQEKP